MVNMGNNTCNNKSVKLPFETYHHISKAKIAWGRAKSHTKIVLKALPIL